jgi:hypothetical protein
MWYVVPFKAVKTAGFPGAPSFWHEKELGVPVTTKMAG